MTTFVPNMFECLPSEDCSCFSLEMKEICNVATSSPEDIFRTDEMELWGIGTTDLKFTVVSCPSVLEGCRQLKMLLSEQMNRDSQSFSLVASEVNLSVVNPSSTAGKYMLTLEPQLPNRGSFVVSWAVIALLLFLQFAKCCGRSAFCTE